MNYFTEQHAFYCGVDLHARRMYLCILDHQGDVVLHKNIPTNADAFLKEIAPYRQDLVVGVECMFCWYWLADLCATEGILFVLGHALYMRHIHGGKAKNDRIDSRKLAGLLRGGLFPISYPYPAEMRATRDLLRRRCYFMRHRAECLAHIENTVYQYNLPPIGKKLTTKANREEALQHFPNPHVRESIAADLNMINHMDEVIAHLEETVLKQAKVDDRKSLSLLRTIPGVGKILSLVLLYEIQDIRRFDNAGQFLSYSRLVKCKGESDGKVQGTKGGKIGNAHLKWAFSEAVPLFLRNNPRAVALREKLMQKYGKGKSLCILARKLGTAVYYMLKQGTVFDEERFFGMDGYSKKDDAMRISA